MSGKAPPSPTSPAGWKPSRSDKLPDGKVRYTGGRDGVWYDWTTHKLVPPEARASLEAKLRDRWPTVDMPVILSTVEAWMEQNPARARGRVKLGAWIEAVFVKREAERARAKSGSGPSGRGRVDPRTAQVRGKSAGDWNGITR